MKKFITVLVLAFTLGMNAQNETFTFPSEKGEKLEGQYIVMNIKGSVEDNYIKTMYMINKMYASPNDVIEAQVHGQFIRIQGMSQLVNGNDMKHLVSFEFKTDKIKITLIDLSQQADLGRYESVIDMVSYDAINESGKRKSIYS
jgi:phosphoribosyl-dephospho-CoA transferase